MIIPDQTVHLHLLYIFLVRAVGELCAFHQDTSYRCLQFRKIVQVFGQRLKKRIILSKNHFDRFIEASCSPGFSRAHRLTDFSVNQLTNPAHKEGISICVISEQLCYSRCIHPGMMILFIFIQHSSDTGFRQTHVNIKIRSNIPWAVHLMPVFLTNPAPQMLYICNTGKYNRLECRYSLCVPADIAVAQLCKKIQKNLIIRCAVNFVDHQNDRAL